MSDGARAQRGPHERADLLLPPVLLPQRKFRNVEAVATHSIAHEFHFEGSAHGALLEVSIGQHDNSVPLKPPLLRLVPYAFLHLLAPGGVGHVRHLRVLQMRHSVQLQAPGELVVAWQLRRLFAGVLGMRR